MALQFVTALRNNRLNEIPALIDVGTAGFIRGYDGTQPATGGAVTTLLFEATFSLVSFAAAVAGVLTANAITDDTSAPAAGVTTWFRCTDSAGAAVIDAPVADLNMNTTTVTLGINVSVTSFVITEANP